MSETTYHLYALCQGSRACDASWLLYLSESGRTRTLPYFFWVLQPEGGGAPIVIDTGFSEESQKARNPDYADYRQQRELARTFRNQTIRCRDAHREPSALGSFHVAETLHLRALLSPET